MHTSTEAEVRLRAFFTPTTPPQTTLDLSNLSLTSLPNLFHSLIQNHPSLASNLTLLNLAHNSLSTLPSFLSHLPNLKILFLLSNSFSSIPLVISQLPACTMLSFKSNILTGRISASSLPKSIEWLILTSNQISSLCEQFPFACRKVRKLMLANNQLSSLPNSFAHYMQSLELLRLSNNRFEAFPTALFELPNLTWLSLAGNPCTRPPLLTASQLPEKYRINNLNEEFDVDWENPFGSGASGMAFPGRHKESGKLVAVKRFKAMRGSDGQALDEIAVCLAAKGIESVVQAIGYWLVEGKDGELKEIGLVLERVGAWATCLGGPPSFESCTRSVYKDGMELKEGVARGIVERVRAGVEGLLQVGVAHGDVYGHNVMVGDGGEVVLGDLGAAWWVPQGVLEGVKRIERRALAVFRKEVIGMVCGEGGKEGVKFEPM